MVEEWTVVSNVASLAGGASMRLFAMCAPCDLGAAYIAEGTTLSYGYQQKTSKQVARSF